MNMQPALTLNAPPAAVVSASAIRPVATDSPRAPKQDGADDRSSGQDRKQGAETTLRYKFDWLVQRQVSAGTIDPKEAVEMIRLFGKTVDTPSAAKQAEAKTDDESNDPVKAVDAAKATKPGTALAIVDSTAKPTATENKGTSVRPTEAASALVDKLRDRFGSEGPYDGSGAKAVSTPMGVIVNDQA